MADLRARDSGVTLIETLVVLVIIGVGAGIVTLALPGNTPPRAIAQEAELLESRLNLAAERSLISARHLRLAWGADGYRLEVWDGEDWVAESKGHQMDGGLTLSDASGILSGVLRINPDGVPDSGAAAVLRVGDGTGVRSLRFDGVRAQVLP